MRKKIAFIVLIIVISGLAAAGYLYFVSPEKAEAPKNSPAPNPTKVSLPPPVPPVPGFDKKKLSTDDPNSIWVVVNKKRPLPSRFTPGDLENSSGGLLRSEASTALKELLTASSSSGQNMKVLSAYRSYSNQQSTYNGWVARDGQQLADTYSARAGHSEHQTGLAVDLGNGTCDLEICFGGTPAGKWLASNAHTYGFIIRYPNGKQIITGYQYEPWHLRYVGKELAAEIYKSGQTMEEFFGLPAAPGY